MQIKRFEADDMTEALRTVKREFGDDAVILSAKEIRPGGFFSAFRKKRVEITAATDYPLKDDGGEAGGFDAVPEPPDTESEMDRVSLSATTPRIKPFIPKMHPFSQPLPVSEHRRLSADHPRHGISRQPVPPISGAVRESEDVPVNGGTPVAVRASLNGRMHRLGTENLTAIPFFKNLGGQKIIAFVGPPGTGKSTAVAKLAGHLSRVEKKRLGLISLDRFHIGANSLLEKVACIMDLPFALARDAQALKAALKEQVDADIVLIDTPGLGAMQPSVVDDVAALLNLARPDETHLVINATVREALLVGTIKSFLPVGIDRLLFTHMDEYGADPTILNLIKSSRLPSSFFSEGGDLCNHLKESTVDHLSRFGGIAESVEDRPLAAFDEIGPKPVASLNRDPGDTGIQFVANRNSELFHHPDCKSVKRINVENITAFDSIEQAMEEGFKPCRACCSIDMFRKMNTDGMVHRRMRAI